MCLASYLRLFICLFGLNIISASAEDNILDLGDNILEELMNTPISVATKTVQSFPESPGSITVITSEEIERRGARDLIDILNFVPGLEVGFDITGTYGVAVRGVWGNEGKVLVLLDGIELNDDMYASFQYGHHIPVEIIERIEIIRGPGSIIYGGAAELAVISITTKKASSESEGMLSVNSGFTDEIYARKGTNFFYGMKDDEWNFNINGRWQEGHHSDRHFVDLWGYDYDTGEDGNSKTGSLLLNTSVKFQGWKHRFIYNRYKTREVYDGFENWDLHFHSYLYQTEYDFKVNDKLTIRPKFLFKQQEPWNTPGNNFGVASFDIQSKKTQVDITAFYQLDNHEFLFGVSHDWVEGKDKENVGNLSQYRGETGHVLNEFYWKRFIEFANLK